MNEIKNVADHVRHTMLDAFEFQATICQLRLPTWGFKDVNQWFETLESDKYVTPNGFISYDKKAVYFENSVNRANSRDLFQLGLDGSNPFEIHHMYRTWMFLRLAPLALITSKEMTKWANSLLQ